MENYSEYTLEHFIRETIATIHEKQRYVKPSIISSMKRVHHLIHKGDRILLARELRILGKSFCLRNGAFGVLQNAFEYGSFKIAKMIYQTLCMVDGYKKCFDEIIANLTIIKFKHDQTFLYFFDQAASKKNKLKFFYNACESHDVDVVKRVFENLVHNFGLNNICTEIVNNSKSICQYEKIESFGYILEQMPEELKNTFITLSIVEASRLTKWGFDEKITDYISKNHPSSIIFPMFFP